MCWTGVGILLTLCHLARVGARDIIWLELTFSLQAARCHTTLGEQEWVEAALIDREQVQDREHPEVRNRQ